MWCKVLVLLAFRENKPAPGKCGDAHGCQLEQLTEAALAVELDDGMTDLAMEIVAGEEAVAYEVVPGLRRDRLTGERDYNNGFGFAWQSFQRTIPAPKCGDAHIGQDPAAFILHQT